MPRYRLFVAKIENVGAKERFFLWTGGKYCFVYTDGRKPKSGREVTDLAVLPALARQWLGECINTIREEFLRDHETEILRRGKAFNERFEAELKIEREKLEQERVNG